jgi:hypothetical protein
MPPGHYLEAFQIKDNWDSIHHFFDRFHTRRFNDADITYRWFDRRTRAHEDEMVTVFWPGSRDRDEWWSAYHDAVREEFARIRAERGLERGAYEDFAILINRMA